MCVWQQYMNLQEYLKAKLESGAAINGMLMRYESCLFTGPAYLQNRILDIHYQSLVLITQICEYVSCFCKNLVFQIYSITNLQHLLWSLAQIYWHLESMFRTRKPASQLFLVLFPMQCSNHLSYSICKTQRNNNKKKWNSSWYTANQTSIAII